MFSTNVYCESPCQSSQFKVKSSEYVGTNVYCESPCQSSQFKVKSSEYVVNKRILRITLSKFSI